jgi:hypothetical protein
LFLNATVEFAVVLVAAASSEDKGIREVAEEVGDGGRAFGRRIEEVQTKLEESFARLSFAPGVR